MMLKKSSAILLIIVMVLSMNSHGAILGVQNNDTWTYETANSSFSEVVSSDPAIQNNLILVDIDTDRPFPIPLQSEFNFTYRDIFTSQNTSVGITWNQIPNKLVSTQIGILPIYPLANMSFNISLDGVEYNFEGYSELIHDIPSDDPSKVIRTKQTTSDIVSTFGIQDGNYSVQITLGRTISSIDGENVTIEDTSITLNVFNNSKTLVSYSEDLLEQLQLSATPVKMRYNQNLSVPVYIGQSEPLPRRSLTLAQTNDNFVEYFLVQEDTETSDTSDTSFVFLLSFISIMLIVVHSKFRKNNPV